MFVVLLLTMMLALMAMRVFLPMPAKVEGKPLGAITLSFRERMLLQRTNMYLIGAVILLGAAGGFVAGPLELIAIVATSAVLMIPARYQVTSSGIALNNVVYRPWTDFRGYRQERTSLVLEAVEGQRDLRLHLLGEHRDAAAKALSRVLGKSSEQRRPGGARAGGGVRP